jgi:hypothetical protein
LGGHPVVLSTTVVTSSGISQNLDKKLISLSSQLECYLARRSKTALY